MKCDICGQEVGNSDEVHKHKEQVHPADESDESMENLERPDLLGDTPEESAASEIPKATH